MTNIENTIDFKHFEKKIYNNFFHKKIVKLLMKHYTQII